MASGISRVYLKFPEDHQLGQRWNGKQAREEGFKMVYANENNAVFVLAYDNTERSAHNIKLIDVTEKLQKNQWRPQCHPYETLVISV